MQGTYIHCRKKKKNLLTILVDMHVTVRKQVKGIFSLFMVFSLPNITAAG